VERREFLERMMAIGLIPFIPRIFPVKLWTDSSPLVRVVGFDETTISVTFEQGQYGSWPDGPIFNTKAEIAALSRFGIQS